MRWPLHKPDAKQFEHDKSRDHTIAYALNRSNVRRCALVRADIARLAADSLSRHQRHVYRQTIHGDVDSSLRLLLRRSIGSARKFFILFLAHSRFFLRSSTLNIAKIRVFFLFCLASWHLRAQHTENAIVFAAHVGLCAQKDARFLRLAHNS